LDNGASHPPLRLVASLRAAKECLIPRIHVIHFYCHFYFTLFCGTGLSKQHDGDIQSGREDRPGFAQTARSKALFVCRFCCSCFQLGYFLGSSKMPDFFILCYYMGQTYTDVDLNECY